MYAKRASAMPNANTAPARNENKAGLAFPRSTQRSPRRCITSPVPRGARSKLRPGHGDPGLSRRLTTIRLTTPAHTPSKQCPIEAMTGGRRLCRRVESVTDSQPRLTRNSNRTSPTISITTWSSSSKSASIMRSHWPAAAQTSRTPLHRDTLLQNVHQAAKLSSDFAAIGWSR